MMTLKVNGHDHQVEAEPDTPLLYVLRDDLKLNGAKFGCGLGQCGACTVIVDGKAVLSCVTPLSAGARASRSRRSRGSARSSAAPDAARLHRRAGGAMRLLHRRHDDAGAGAAAANSKPTDEQIRAEWSRNLCRCGTHMRILRAVHRASRLMDTADSAAAYGMEASDEQARDRRSPRRPRGRRRADRQLLASATRWRRTRRAAAPKPPAASRARRTWIPGSASMPTAAITVFTGKAELGQGFKTALSADRRRRARRSLQIASSSSPPTPGAPPMKAILPAAIRCRTAAPRSAMPQRRSARY